MLPEEHILMEAIHTRDHRFDGKFFIAVKTTGIYCRTICPAKPKRENMMFYESALAAESAGYRPCLRCRPECAPGSSAWIGKRAVVRRVLSFIENHHIFEYESEEAFASKFGMTGRHLRRLFIEEFGRTPRQIAAVYRLNFARRLVCDTKISMSQIAFAAGFNSVRRFNSAFAERFKRTPTELRVKKGFESEPVRIGLSYRPPFDWQGLLDFYRNHLIEGVETITEDTYSRTFTWKGKVGNFTAKNDPKASKIWVSVNYEDPSQLFSIMRKVRTMFDLDSDPYALQHSFAGQGFEEISEKWAGIRIPRGWDAFEVGVTAILGQLVSTEAACKLVAQFVSEYGEHTEVGTLFPDPNKVSRSDLLGVKTTQKRRESIQNFAQFFVANQDHFEPYHDQGTLMEQIRQLPGIGSWTSEIIRFRGLDDTDGFPATDLILKRALALHPEFDPNLVRPWRSYLALMLWREYAHTLSGKSKK
jgi:AraC family transcriptional regulator, regulatory protein of adaptative response / DNA-3-methyladenine glycosylase II